MIHFEIAISSSFKPFIIYLTKIILIDSSYFDRIFLSAFRKHGHKQRERKMSAEQQLAVCYCLYG